MLGLTAEIFHLSAVTWLTCCSFRRERPKKTFCQVHDIPLLRQALAPPVPGFGMWHAELRRLDKTTSYTRPDLEGEPGVCRTVSVPRRGATGMQWFRHCNVDGKTRCTWRVCILQAHASNAGVGQRQNNILVLRSRIRIHSLGEKLPEDVRSYLVPQACFWRFDAHRKVNWN